MCAHGYACQAGARGHFLGFCLGLPSGVPDCHNRNRGPTHPPRITEYGAPGGPTHPPGIAERWHRNLPSLAKERNPVCAREGRHARKGAIASGLGSVETCRIDLNYQSSKQN
jgi:hypothetical protein